MVYVKALMNILNYFLTFIVCSCCSVLPNRVECPKDMVWIPGGEFTMGADSTFETKPDERPAHTVKVDGFWMDITPVTNKQFKQFIDATGYVTTAEKAPLLEEIMAQVPPGTPEPPKELLVAASLVFSPPKKEVSLNDHHLWWQWVKGANWKHPLGPDSTIDGKEDHPVVHVCYNDALAYCKWANKRLPTEAEWEFAAYAGKYDNKYVWGNEEFSEEKPQANLWQGIFPNTSTKPQGAYGTTSVKAFSPNSYGLYDMAGNVWQLCADMYNASYYTELKKQGTVSNPQGPTKSYDPDEPYAIKYVLRGGSFLCHKSYCKGYRITARMKTSADTSLNHLGFRCVMSAK